jgi:hypothetical protein
MREQARPPGAGGRPRVTRVAPPEPPSAVAADRTARVTVHANIGPSELFNLLRVLMWLRDDVADCAEPARRFLAPAGARPGVVRGSRRHRVPRPSTNCETPTSLTQRTETITAPLSPTGLASHLHYTLAGPFSREAQDLAAKRGERTRSARRRQ